MNTKPTKAIVGACVAIIGTGFTSALAFAAPGSGVFVALTILSAMLTTAGVYLGVYQTTNDPVSPNADEGPFSNDLEHTVYKPGSGWSKGES